MHNLNELKIWEKSMKITEAVYKISTTFPDDEKYNLTSQVRRSAVSIPSNIAEGAGRNSDNEFKHFLGVANGSLYELQTQVMLICQLYPKIEIPNEILNMVNEFQKMIYALIKKL